MKKFYSLLTLGLLLSFTGLSQTYLTTPLVAGNGQSGITFNVTAHQGVFIEDIKATFTASGTAQIWYNPIAISGPPTVSTAGGWIQIATGAVTASGAGLAGSVAPTNLFMPAGSTFGFYVGGVGLSYTNGTTPSSWTDGTITIDCGSLIGYGGGAPNPTFHIRMFNGAVGYSIAPTAPNNANTSDLFTDGGCPGLDSVFAVIGNSGTNQIDSVMVNWMKNGVLQTAFHHIGLLDTFGGLSPDKTQVFLGMHTFVGGVTDTFEVWTTLPNGVIDTLTGNDSTSAFLKPQLPGGTYTIGGTSPDYATWNLAVADLNSIGICGPVVFNVRQGTYTEQIKLEAIIGTSSTNTVTFQPDPANTAAVILTHAAIGTADNYVVQFSGAEYVTIDSITITATGATYGYAVEFLGAEYVTVKNCEINASATSTSSLSMPIRNTTGVNVEYCTIENNVLNNGYYGMYWYGGNTTSKEIGNVIRGNEINNFTIYGMMFYYQGGGTVEGNKIEQSTSATSSSYGMYMYYNDSTDVMANQVILYGSGTNYGMYLYRAHGSATNKAQVQNNMISTSTSSTGTSYGVYFGYGQHVNFYHNSINCQGGSATAGRGLYLLGSTSTLYGSIDIKNNIFANSGPGVGAYVNTGAISTFLTGMDYNIFTATSGNIISQNGTNHTTVASWTTATMLDSNSISALPGFVTGTNLHLQGGVAADAGANVGVMVDIDGDARPLLPSTGYDIGADEYIPPTCPMGYGLRSDSLTAYSADITWVKGSNDTTWIFEYGAPGFTPGTGTSVFSTIDTIRLAGLTPVTDYCVYVRGICGVGDTSMYFGPHCFKTRCVSAMAGTYTIDGGLPTGGTNYNSFADAMNALNSCGITAPTVFNVKQGTYTEQVNIGSIIGTSSTNTVTFKADPTNTAAAILTYAATTTLNNYVVQFEGADNIIFDSLTVNPTGASYGYGFRFMNADGCVVKNCNINCVTNTSSLQVPIYNQSGAANITQNCTIENNTTTKGYYGMYWYGISSVAKEIGNTIKDNDISDFYVYGMMFYYQGGGVLEGNTIEQMPAAPSTSYGMYIYYNDSVKVRSNHVTLTGSGTNYGMYAYRAHGSASNKSEFTNNMIITSPSSTGTSYGTYLGYGQHINFYHNSIHVRGGSATAGRALYLLGSTSTLYGDVDIRNNIFSNSGPGEGMYIVTGAISTFLTHMDHNIYDAASGNLINQNGTIHTAMSTYVAATLLDSNSLNGNPGFLSGTDLHLQGAIAYDNGDPTLGIMTDFDGQTRPLAPSTGYDIGADEYIPPTCPSPYSMKTDTVSTSAAQISWTNGPADISWQIEYGAPGFMQGSGTLVNSATNPVTVTGLLHSTCYDVWLRSICSVGDTSLWTGPFNFCTKCAPVADYCTDFDSDGLAVTPFCWETFLSTTGNGYIRTYNFNFRSAGQCVYMYTGSDASAVMMLIAPEVTNLSAGTHRANFWARGDSTIIIGTMSDPANPGTFTVWDTLAHPSPGSYTNYKVDFSAYSGTDNYVAILHDATSTYDYLYIDDYCWEAIPSCEKAPAVTVLNAGIDPTSINLGWNFDTTHVSYIINYGPAGYDPISNPAGGQTTTSTTNFVNITGLQSLTEYCFWVKAVCTNGDTSFWDGPHCGETGCPASVNLPYFNDFSSYMFVSGVGEQLPLCWTEGKGALSSSTTLALGTSNWTYDGFANVGTDGSAKMNIYATNRFEWFVSPVFNLGTDPNTHRYIEFDIAMTDYANTGAGVVGVDDSVAFLVSYNGGISWSNADILELWDTGRAPSNTGDHIVHLLKGKTGLVQFAFYATSNISNQDNDWFIDNFSIKDTVFAGVEEISFNDNFKVFPNPNNGVFTIQNDGNAQQSSVKLLDIQGRVVYDNQFYFTRNGRKQIEVNKLTSGVYILLLQSEGKLEQHRIVIE